LLGQILASPADTFLLVSGWGCTDCDAMQQIVLRRLGDGPLEWGGSQSGDFDMPGVETDYEDSTRIIAHTRLFWGRCLSSEPASVVQLDSLKPVGADSVWVKVAEPTADSIRTREGVRPAAIGRDLVAAVSRGECHEIVPRNRLSSP
jgi:hypothetical protein